MKLITLIKSQQWTPVKRRGTPPAADKQARDLIRYLDALAEHLAPLRRPQDRDAPECSPRELKALAAVGRIGAVTMTDLAAILKSPLSTATHTVDRLVAKGLVSRKRLTRDRRIVQVSFSRRGKEIHRFVVRSRHAAARGLLKALSLKDRQALLRQMAKMMRVPLS